MGSLPPEKKEVHQLIPQCYVHQKGALNLDGLPYVHGSPKRHMNQEFSWTYFKGSAKDLERAAVTEDNVATSFSLALSGCSFADPLKKNEKRERVRRSDATTLASVAVALPPALSVSSFAELFQGVCKRSTRKGCRDGG